MTSPIVVEALRTLVDKKDLTRLAAAAAWKPSCPAPPATPRSRPF